MLYSDIESPVGRLTVVRDGEGITGLYFSTPRPKSIEPNWVRADDAFDDIQGQLADYFEGTRREFDLPLHPIGTPFQLAVWGALHEIPYGHTSSYGKQAASIGKPEAVRAVGAANGRNPISIIVPCHRVVGANGSLTGYGGGLPTKQWLLAHEQGAQPLNSF